MFSKGLILCLILGFTLAQKCSMIVTIKDTGCNYDLTSLQGLNFTGIDLDGDNYYWTFCEEVENTPACSVDPRTGMCQVSLDKTSAYNAGSYLNTTTVPLTPNGRHFFFVQNLILISLFEDTECKGLQLSYLLGDMCVNQTPRSTQFNLKCDKTATTPVLKNLTVQELPNCVYAVEFVFLFFFKVNYKNL